MKITEVPMTIENLENTVFIYLKAILNNLKLQTWEKMVKIFATEYTSTSVNGKAWTV